MHNFQYLFAVCCPVPGREFMAMGDESETWQGWGALPLTPQGKAYPLGYKVCFAPTDTLPWHNSFDAG